MKKVIVIVMAVIGIVSLLMVGSALEPGAVAKEKVEEKGVTKWIGQTDVGADHPMFASAQRMCEAITAASDGRLRLTVEPAGAVVPANTEFDAVHNGVIDFAVSYSFWWGDQFPARGLFCTRAGGMSPMAKYLWFISGDGAELAQAMIDDYDYDYDVHIIPGGGYLSTPSLFLQSKKPVESVDDLKGLEKIRSFGDEAEILSRMGAWVIRLPGSEIWKALEEEEIDAFTFSSPYIHWQCSFQEVAEYVYVSGCREPHFWAQFIVNETSWNELPDDLKWIVQGVSNVEAITSYDEQRQLDIAFLAAFQGYGCTVETISPKIERAFLQAARLYYDDQATTEGAFYAKVLESLRDFEEVLENFPVEAITSYDEQCQGIYSWSP